MPAVCCYQHTQFHPQLRLQKTLASWAKAKCGAYKLWRPYLVAVLSLSSNRHLFPPKMSDKESPELSDASHNEKSTVEARNDDGYAHVDERRKSVAMNIVENPLKVSLALHSAPSCSCRAITLIRYLPTAKLS